MGSSVGPEELCSQGDPVDQAMVKNVSERQKNDTVVAVPKVVKSVLRASL